MTEGQQQVVSNKEDKLRMFPNETQLPAASHPEVLSDAMSFTRFADQFNMAVALLDPTLNVIFANNTLSQMLGIGFASPNQQRPFPQLFQRLNGEQFQDWWTESLKIANGRVEGIFRFCAVPGIEKYVHLKFSRLQEGYWLLQAQDVTSEERQRLQLRARSVQYYELLSWLEALAGARNWRELVQVLFHYGRHQWGIQQVGLLVEDGPDRRWISLCQQESSKLAQKVVKKERAFSVAGSDAESWQLLEEMQARKLWELGAAPGAAVMVLAVRHKNHPVALFWLTFNRADQPGTISTAEKHMLARHLRANLLRIYFEMQCHRAEAISGGISEERQALLDSLLQQPVYAVVTVNRKGRVTFFSKGAHHILGWKPEEVEGLPVHTLLKDSHENIRKIIRTLGRQKKIVHYECEVIHRNGQAIPFNLSLAPICKKNGTAESFLIIGKDNTEKKRAEEELQQRSEEIEDLVYLITHNLKTPIVSVEGFASLLVEEVGVDLNPEALRYLERIRKNVEFMNVMISDLLEFSRFGKMEPTFEKIHLQEMVDALIEDIRVHYPQADLSFEIPQPLPVINGHPDGIKTVFENLLSNAAKYRKANQTARIKIWYEEKPRFYAFHVEDNGIGMDAEFKKKAFNLFQRGANVGEVEGTGVGLAICKKIVQKHGGLITIHSESGKGTTVSFTIPKLAG